MSGSLPCGDPPSLFAADAQGTSSRCGFQLLCLAEASERTWCWLRQPPVTTDEHPEWSSWSPGVGCPVCLWPVPTRTVPNKHTATQALRSQPDQVLSCQGTWSVWETKLLFVNKLPNTRLSPASGWRARCAGGGGGTLKGLAEPPASPGSACLTLSSVVLGGLVCAGEHFLLYLVAFILRVHPGT